MYLRPLDNKDVDNMLEWMLDPIINQFYLFDASKMNKEKALDFITNSVSETNAHYAIVDDNDEYLGTISLKNIDKTNKKAEYAIAIRKAFQGKGVSKIATDLILQKAFEELDLNKVYLNVLKDNIRANKFYSKYGFVYEGTFREDICINGVLCDLSWYSMLKKDFKVK